MKWIQVMFIIVFLPMFSCCKHSVPSAGREQKDDTVKNTGRKIRVSFVAPENRRKVLDGEEIRYALVVKDTAGDWDSIRIRLDNNVIKNVAGSELSGSLFVTAAGMGMHTMRAELYRMGKLAGSGSVHIVVFPDQPPQMFTYEVVKVYPHDPSAYTQGLVYEKGIMYESTGLRGESTLRKWVPESGKLLSSLSLPPGLFGEGCTILGDDIYQITWTSRVGFVYDKATFSVKKRLKYSTQGWGLTTNGKHLIMSDGSHYIYFLDTAYFSVTGRIEVYDDKGPVKQLNELEYINNEIWANVYMTDDIVRIDPETGKVIARISCKGLLPLRDYGTDTDVLNGIAWDPEGNRLFLTGKKWPKLFEVRPVPLQ